MLWHHYLASNDSFISREFHFLICLVTLCLECDDISLKYDTASFIALPIVESKCRKRRINLYDCLDDLTKCVESNGKEL